MSLRWIENFTNVSEFLKVLAKEITNGGLDTNWSLAYPANIALITKCFTLKKNIGLGQGKDVYIEFFQPDKVANKGVTIETANNFYIEVRYGTNYTNPVNEGEQGTYAEDCGSAPYRLSWFKSNTTSTIKTWLPIQYWISVTDNQIIFVVAGDENANADDRLISFAYIGKIKSFDNSAIDQDGNFGITTSSDFSPYDYLTQAQLSNFGDRTANGVTDISMLQTATGFPFQSHFVAFTTPDEFLNKKLAGPSSFTGKYHMTPVYVVHPYDGYRGMLEGVVATDRSSITDFDEMIFKDEENSLKKTYKIFLVNAPYSLLNNSTNVLYALALLEKEEPLADTPVTGATLTESNAEAKVGEDFRLGVNVLPYDATNKAVTWASADTGIATVDETGKVHCVAVGTTTITATTQDGNHVASCIFTVISST